MNLAPAVGVDDRFCDISPPTGRTLRRAALHGQRRLYTSETVARCTANRKLSGRECHAERTNQLTGDDLDSSDVTVPLGTATVVNASFHSVRRPSHAYGRRLSARRLRAVEHSVQNGGGTQERFDVLRTARHFGALRGLSG